MLCNLTKSKKNEEKKKMEQNNNSNNCLQKYTIIVLICRIGVGFAEDHESFAIKFNPKNNIDVTC